VVFGPGGIGCQQHNGAEDSPAPVRCGRVGQVSLEQAWEAPSQFVPLLVGHPQAGHAVAGSVAPQVDVLLVEVTVEVGEEGCGVAAEGAGDRLEVRGGQLGLFPYLV
jgi:hypothetical protein